MFFYNRGKYITLNDLTHGRIDDETTISVSRLAVNMRIMELSSSGPSKKNSTVLKTLIRLVGSNHSITHRENVESHYYMSAKNTRLIFEGMKNVPGNAFSISNVQIQLQQY